MKKILLMLASGLIIACMAGSALAFPAYSSLISVADASTVSGKDLTISGPYQVQFKVDQYSYLEGGQTYTYNYLVTPIKNKNGNNIGSASDVEVTGPSSFYLSALAHSGDIGSFLDPNIITINVKNIVKDSAGGFAEYRVTIGNQDLTVASTNVTVPEFPTIAVPVAGILGLLFIFGRKRGDL